MYGMTKITRSDISGISLPDPDTGLVALFFKIVQGEDKLKYLYLGGRWDGFRIAKGNVITTKTLGIIQLTTCNYNFYGFIQQINVTNKTITISSRT